MKVFQTVTIEIEVHLTALQHYEPETGGPWLEHTMAEEYTVNGVNMSAAEFTQKFGRVTDHWFENTAIDNADEGAWE